MADRLRAGPYLQLLQYLRGNTTSPLCRPPRKAAFSQPSSLDNLSTHTASQYPFDSQAADTIFRSCEGHDFRVHIFTVEQHLLKHDSDKTPRSLWSAFHCQCSANDLVVHGLPVVQTAIRRDALSTLLGWCYPRPLQADIICWTAQTATSAAALGAIKAAIDHGFHIIVQRYYTRLSQIVAEEPLAVYCSIMHLQVGTKWSSLVTLAARELARSRPKALHTLSLGYMNLISAKEYHTLLKHYYRCQRKIYNLCLGEALARPISNVSAIYWHALVPQLSKPKSNSRPTGSQQCSRVLVQTMSLEEHSRLNLLWDKQLQRSTMLFKSDVGSMY